MSLIDEIKQTGDQNLTIYREICNMLQPQVTHDSHSYQETDSKRKQKLIKSKSQYLMHLTRKGRHYERQIE